MASFDVSFRTTASLHPDGEPDRFISAYTGVISHIDDETGEATRVGRVRAYRIEANLALLAGEPLYDVCDCHSQEMHEVYSAVYEPNGYVIRADLAERYHAFTPDVLVLDYVVLAPEWRGLKLGLMAVRTTVERLGGGCDLAVCFIAPLRRAAHRELRVPARWLPATRKGAAGKLRRYYRRMGFRRIPGTRYHALPLALDIPSAEDLIEPSGGD